MDALRWARSDGNHIAYRVVEVDPASDVTVLLATGLFLPVDAMWEDRGHAHFLDGLAALGRLVVFDRRGVGASDPVTDWDEPVVAQSARDAAAVIEAVGRGPVHVVGWEWGSLVAATLAATRPELVASLVHFHGMPSAEDVAAVFGMPVEEVGDAMAAWVTGTSATGVQGDLSSAATYAPSRADDPALQRWVDDAGRRGCSPSVAARMWRSYCTPGYVVDYGAITAPVLVLRRRDVQWVPREMSDELVRLMPGATLVELPGVDLAPYAGDVDALLVEIARFVTGEDGRVFAGDRHLAAVLFTDIVGSTEAARRLGDEQWRGVLDAHDRATAQVVGRHGGRVVKQTGDGSLALFPLATRAVGAAVELRTELAEIGVAIRQGIHVGEVTDRAGDVAGLAVHVAARVMAQAGPGEIVTTATVPLVVDAGTVPIAPRGRVELRGVEGTWELYEVGRPG